MSEWIDVNHSYPEENGDWLEIKVDGNVLPYQVKWWEAAYQGGNFVNVLFEKEKRHVSHWRKAEPVESSPCSHDIGEGQKHE